ncbi:MAG: GAF domain-containing protein, partial [Thermodesulfobacteriota bacterium]
ILTSEMNLQSLFEIVIAQTNQLMDTERSTVFLHDAESKNLWSFVATGMGKDLIRIPDDAGVAGWVFQNNRAALINDAYADPRFLPDIDRKSGFRTRGILCIPLLNRSRQCIGVLQALNKSSGDFSPEDLDMLTSISHYVAIALENAKLYEELKLMEKARERIINHLSHELKTPLAIIGAAMLQLAKKLKKESNDAESYHRILRRGQRNIDRLLNLQEKIEDILNRKIITEKDTISKILEDAASLVEETLEETGGSLREGLEVVLKRVESLYAVDNLLMESIELGPLIIKACDRAKEKSKTRDLEIIPGVDSGVMITMDRKVLEKVVDGLLKNAVENTPDEGRIEVFLRKEGGAVRLNVRDTGVGISLQNQKLIFIGFIHTRETGIYSSKKPYDFGAGGTGSDLLRTKLFSERFGFEISFHSSRCTYIPDDSDLCPGRISSCPHVTEKSGCFLSGGTTFSLLFQADERIPFQPESNSGESLL